MISQILIFGFGVMTGLTLMGILIIVFLGGKDGN